MRGATAMVYDVIVVGAGPAGITAAMELRDSGLRIALVESGDLDFDPDIQALYDGEVTGHDALDLTGIRLRMFGGTSNHWGGHCLPLDRLDFSRRPLSGMSGWPFDFDHLRPFYGRAHVYCDLGPFDYSRALTPGLGDDDFLLLGDPRIETVAARGSGPQNFGTAFHDTLRANPNVDLLLRRNVVGLIVDGDGRVGGVEARPLDGEVERIEGRIVVLAAGAVETARLMLISNARNGQRLGDAGDLVGRCYMDHPSGGAAFLHFRRPMPPLAYWQQLSDAAGKEVRYAWRLSDAVLEAEGLANSHYYVLPFATDPATRQRQRDAKSSVNALKSIAKWGLGREQDEFRLSQAYCDFITNADSFVADQWLVRTGRVGVDRALLRYEVEQMPTRDNRVTLSDSRDPLGLPKPVVNWSPGATERDSVVRAMELIGQACGEAEIGRIELESHFDEPYFNCFTSWHQMGTMRMAVSAQDGVVDPDCRVHGTPNLFVAGGAVMPSVGRSNPTLTIVALSIRLADHIKSEVATL